MIGSARVYARLRYEQCYDHQEAHDLEASFFFQAEDGIRDFHVTGVQTCALPISLAASAGGQARSSPRIAPRSMVTVSWVVTASSKGAESSTRLTPTSPTRRANSVVTRKIRSGSSERRSRARRSTSTVWAKLAVSSPATASATPAAYRQRTSKAKRSAASRSDKPPGVAAPSPRPGSTVAPTAARWARTGPRTARVGTAGPAPWPGTGTPSPRAAPPHTSGHQRWATPG